MEPPSGELIGIVVAIIILLIAFGSVVAAGMPIFVALVGLAAGQMAVLVVANFLDVATFAPTLAAMIGLGVGIDYALFVMNRFRQAVLAGHDPKAAAHGVGGDRRSRGPLRGQHGDHRAARACSCCASTSSTACPWRPP